MSGSDVDIRPLQTLDELRACVTLQRETWGDEFTDVVPASILKVSQRVGGVAAGAFDADGKLLGFVYGLTGVEDGRIVHWSDMLAVRPEARNLGLGRRLKDFQRHAVQQVGGVVIYWTYDPLVARNAHLNINVFGAHIAEYVEDMYGETESPLHRGIGTDRFIVAWPVADAEVEKGLTATHAAGVNRTLLQSPILNSPNDRRNAAVVIATREHRVQLQACLERRGFAVNGEMRAEETAWQGARALSNWCVRTQAAPRAGVIASTSSNLPTSVSKIFWSIAN